jgi:general secretion pathway protein E
MTASSASRRSDRGTPRTPPQGRLDWRLLLDWLRDDGWIAADDVDRVARRLSAGSSALHALVRLGGAGLVRRDAAGGAVRSKSRR